MEDNKYSKAYKEVLEIIKYFPEEEYNKIPKEKIEYYRDNMDKNYEFSIDPEKDLAEQNISKETNSIIIALYQDYFATEKEKQKINEILKANDEKEEQEKREKYDPNDIFKENAEQVKTEEKQQEENTALVEKKENFFTKFRNFILKLLKK